MKKLTGLLVLLTATGVAYADSSLEKSAAHAHAKLSKTHSALVPAAGNPGVTRKVTLPFAATDAETLTVTGVRHRNLDLRSDPGLALSPAAPRTLSDPVAIDLVDRPVLVTLQTGNTEELRERPITFPFQSIPDRSGRDTEFLRIKLSNFKLD